jgi:hypothetical protein
LLAAFALAGGRLMADQADVEAALVALAANALYPQGAGATSVIGRPCFIYRGVPTAPALADAVRLGQVHGSVCGLAEGMRDVTRFPRVWQAIAPVPATLGVSVHGQNVSFSGQCAAGQLAGISLHGVAYPYAVQATDTPATVASNLAAILRGAGFLIQYEARTITAPQAHGVVARVVAGAGALLEIRRQVQDFAVSLWCADPASRDLAANAVDISLAGIGFFALADGSSARMIFRRTEARDDAQDAGLYRRSLVYSVEYPTTRGTLDPAMLFGNAEFTADGAVIARLNA